MSNCNCRRCTLRRDGRPDVFAPLGSDGRIRTNSKARRCTVEVTDAAGERRLPMRSDSEERALDFARSVTDGRAVVLIDDGWGKPLREATP